MKRPRPLQRLDEMLEAAADALKDSCEARSTLHEAGWLGVSGKGVGGDIRALAQAWADAEARAARAQR